MAITSSSIMITSLLLTSLALLGFLTTSAHARPLPPGNSGNSKLMMVIMINNIGRSSTETREETGNDHSCNHMSSESSLTNGKKPPSPPSPRSSPTDQQGTNVNDRKSPSSSTPNSQLELAPSCGEGSPCNNGFISMFTNFGKTPKSPPSPMPAPPTHQGTLIQQPVQRRSLPAFQLIKSMFTDLEKTPKSPPSPKPAPSKHQGTIDQPIEKRSHSDFQFASS